VGTAHLLQVRSALLRHGGALLCSAVRLQQRAKPAPLAAASGAGRGLALLAAAAPSRTGSVLPRASQGITLSLGAAAAPCRRQPPALCEGVAWPLCQDRRMGQVRRPRGHSLHLSDCKHCAAVLARQHAGQPVGRSKPAGQPRAHVCPKAASAASRSGLSAARRALCTVLPLGTLSRDSRPRKSCGLRRPGRVTALHHGAAATPRGRRGAPRQQARQDGAAHVRAVGQQHEQLAVGRGAVGAAAVRERAQRATGLRTSTAVPTGRRALRLACESSSAPSCLPARAIALATYTVQLPDTA